MKRKLKEGSMSDIDILAQEAPNFNSFIKAFTQEYPHFEIGDGEKLKVWLKSIYDDAKSTQEQKPLSTKEHIKKLREDSDYKQFFKDTMKKFNITSPDQLKNDQKKKQFFDYIQNNWKG